MRSLNKWPLVCTAVSVVLSVCLLPAGASAEDDSTDDQSSRIAPRFVIGAGFGAGHLLGDGKFTEGTGWGPSASISLGFQIVEPLAIEWRLTYLEINTDVGSPRLFEIAAGLRGTIRFGPVLVEPSLLFGYTAFVESCTDVPLVGEVCYDPSDPAFSLGASVSYLFDNRMAVGIQAAYDFIYSFESNNGYTWDNIQVIWRFWI